MESEAEHVLSRGESLLWIGKFALAFFGILALIYLLTVLTPKIAKWVDKKRGKPSDVTEYRPETFEVKGLFDADRLKKTSDKTNTSSGNEETENGKGEKAG